MSVAFSKVNKQAHISKRAVCWLTELSAVIVSAGEIFQWAALCLCLLQLWTADKRGEHLGLGMEREDRRTAHSWLRFAGTETVDRGLMSKEFV